MQQISGFVKTYTALTIINNIIPEHKNILTSQRNTRLNYSLGQK